MSTPVVSFVVLSYNYARFIGQTIEGILAQEGNHDFEIVIVDDASTDNSHEVISSFTDPRIKYIRHERNLGHAATVTDGLHAARGKLIARIDSDDRHRPTFLNEVLPIFEQHTDVAMVYGDAAMINDEGEITAQRLDTEHGARDFHGNEYVALLQKNFICAPTIIARRDAWLNALPIPEGLSFHDWWFTLQIARKAPVYYRNAVLADYRVHRANYHAAITLNKGEEASIVRLLNDLFAQREADAELERAKQSARHRIYATHYLLLATKYFGAEMIADARRCYLEAVRREPAYLSDVSVMRQLLATFIGLPAYRRLKGILGRA